MKSKMTVGEWIAAARAEQGDGDEGCGMFARPGSALRRSSRRNPRCLPCPTCGAADKLTPADRAHGYQCDDCARRDEGGMGDY